MVERCQGCPYKGEACGPRGEITSPFVIVGEAPGNTEIQRGIPFIGQSGKLLDTVLEKAGLERGSHEAFVTNAMVCRPTDAPPKAAAVASCRPRLLDELSIVPRRAILALGNSAVRSITGNNDLKITQVRGKVIQSEFGPVIPALHPAALLRNGGEFPRWAQDLRYAVDIYLGRGVRSPGETKFQVVRNSSQLKQAVERLLTFDVLDADIETGGTGFNARKDPILCLAIRWAKNRVVIIPREFCNTPEIRRLLESRQIKFTWHNGKFDTSFFRTLRIRARVDEDTMLMHYALNEVRGTHDLKQLARDLLGADNYEAELKKYLKKKSDSFELVPPEVLYKYAAKDADYTGGIREILAADLGKSRNLSLGRLYSQLLLPASAFLQRVEEHGIFIGTPELDTLERELSRDVKSKLRRLTSVADEFGWDPALFQKEVGAVKKPVKFNPGSPKQVLWLLRRMGFRVYNTRKETLAELPRTPFTVAIRAYRRSTKSLSTYAYGIRDRIDDSDGRVHSTFLIHGTTTGRLSSRGPNLQNIPRVTSSRWGKPIRDVFQAPPGFTLLEFDYSQAELRVLAHLSDDDFLTSVYTEGRDLHDEVSLRMFGPKFTKEQRIRAKFLNFGIAYGREANSIVREFKVSTAEASEMIRTWWANAPQAYEYIQSQRRAASSGRTLSTPLGRRRRFGLVTPQTVKNLENEAANFAIQSTASDLTLISAMRIQPELRRYGGHVINLVHDSILVEVSLDHDIDAIGRQVVDIMVDTPRRLLKGRVPFEASMAIGTAWGSLNEKH